MVDDTSEQHKSSSSSQSRFSLWLALTAFSIIVLAEIADRTKDLEEDRPSVLKWAMAVAALTFIFGFLALVATVLARDHFVATPLEAGLIILCLGFWMAGLPNSMNPKNYIAVDAGELEGVLIPRTREVLPNVYFFSWASFFMSLLVARSFAVEVLQAKAPERVPKHTVWLWYGITVASLVVLATASRTLHLGNCDALDNKEDLSYVYGSIYGETLDRYDSVCKRVKFGVALGLISAVVTAAMGTVVFVLPALVEAIAAVITLILWCVGVGLLTFGDRAPATTVGNFYFGSWAAFIFALFLASDAVTEAVEKLTRDGNANNNKASLKAPPAAAAPATTTPEPEITIEGGGDKDGV